MTIWEAIIRELKAYIDSEFLRASIPDFDARVEMIHLWSLDTKTKPYPRQSAIGI